MTTDEWNEVFPVTHKIELGFEELCLVEKALELYGRVGMLQFDNLTLCNSLQKLVWDKDLNDKFRKKADELKEVFGYSSNSYPSIFNKVLVGDDCRQAIHMYQQIRHKRYLDRVNSGEQTDKHFTVDEYPADTCNLADINQPKFKI